MQSYQANKIWKSCNIFKIMVFGETQGDHTTIIPRSYDQSVRKFLDSPLLKRRLWNILPQNKTSIWLLCKVFYECKNFNMCFAKYVQLTPTPTPGSHHPYYMRPQVYLREHKLFLLMPQGRRQKGGWGGSSPSPTKKKEKREKGEEERKKEEREKRNQKRKEVEPVDPRRCSHGALATPRSPTAPDPWPWWRRNFAPLWQNPANAPGFHGIHADWFWLVLFMNVNWSNQLIRSFVFHLELIVMVFDKYLEEINSSWTGW